MEHHAPVRTDRIERSRRALQEGASQMTTVEDIVDEIDAKVDESVTLTVGKMVDDKLEAHRLLLAEDAAGGFREQVNLTRGRMSERTPTSYATTAELDDGEYFVIDDEDTLEELAEFRRLADNIGSIP